jgi:hypothetical protein
MTSRDDAIDDDPIFVCAPHRSRGTYLQRLLNFHPGIVIWGEHGGWINKLAELEGIGERQARARLAPTEAEVESFRGKQLGSLLEFNPWLNPLQTSQLSEHHRRLLTGVFRQGLAASQRWGLKEIRYNAPATTAFLARLYPRAQFLVLRRDLVELCVSNILAEWSAQRLVQMQAGRTWESAREVLADCAYALCVIDAQLQRSLEQLGERAFEIAAADVTGAMPEVLAFLNLLIPDGFMETAALLARYPLGATPKELSVGLLDQAYVRECAPAFIAEAQAEIARRGPNLARLKGLAGGRYSFLVGDHDLQGTSLSSLF